MLGKRKPNLAIVIGGGEGKGPPESDDTEAEGEDSEDFEAMAQEAIDAIKADDAAGFASAVKAMVGACSMGD